MWVMQDRKAPQDIFPASDSLSQWCWSPRRKSFCSEREEKEISFKFCQRFVKKTTLALAPYLWGAAVVDHVPHYVADLGQVGLSDALHLGGDGAHHQVKLLVLLVPQQHDATFKKNKNKYTWIFPHLSSLTLVWDSCLSFWFWFQY